jgi:uncharacterized protein
LIRDVSASAPTVLDGKAAAIATVARRYGVRRLEVVSSAARGEDFDPARSDVDFLVTFETDASLAPLEQFFGLRDALAELLGRPVDLIETGAVTNPYVRREFDATRELVFAA